MCWRLSQSRIHCQAGNQVRLRSCLLFLQKDLTEGVWSWGIRWMQLFPWLPVLWGYFHHCRLHKPTG